MWEVRQMKNHEYHVFPRDEFNLHWPDRYCPCLPSTAVENGSLFNRGGTVVTHNSHDGREANEEPQRDHSQGNTEVWTALNQLGELQ